MRAKHPKGLQHIVFNLITLNCLQDDFLRTKRKPEQNTDNL